MTSHYRLRDVFELPALYRWLGIALGRRGRQWPLFAREYVRARPGDRILDLGCGAAGVLAELPDGVTYVGVDHNPDSIGAARRRFGTRGAFLCGAVDHTAVDELGIGSFDLVIAHGLLHHLDDRQALEFFGLAHAALRPRGRLVTGDGCYRPGQSWIERHLLAWDRGRHVRDEAGYAALAGQQFRSVESSLRTDTAFVPYTMLYLICTA